MYLENAITEFKGEIMAFIELKNVYFEYPSYEQQEEMARKEQERIKQEKIDKKNKKKNKPEITQNDSDNSSNFFDKTGESNDKDLPNEKAIYAVKNLSLSINEGEYIGLVGHNGSGKSTLSKLFNGLLTPTLGEVLVNGKTTKVEDNLFEIRRDVGMVFQNPDNQMIASIVEDDIAFGPENIGVPAEEIKERVEFALKAVGMQDYAKATPFKLSGGQKQRIAIAGMLAIKPKVLVLDEATAMLDPQGRKEVIKVAKMLNKTEGMTIINISHYMDEVQDCDRVIVLDKGEKVMEDTPQNIFNKRDELRKIGLNIPPILELARLLREKGIEVGENIFNEKELVEKIWQLSQKN